MRSPQVRHLARSSYAVAAVLGLFGATDCHHSDSGPTVSVAAFGPGTISANPEITCAPDCRESFAAGTMLTLTATANADGRFLGWDGACSGQGTVCTLTIAADAQTVARFATQPALCADGRQDGDETARDCGGSCAPCNAGQRCSAKADCRSGACTDNLCADDGTPAFDGVRPAKASSGTTIVLVGNHFSQVAGITATIGGKTVNSVTYLSSTELALTVPAGITPGLADITLNIPGSAPLMLTKGLRYFYAPIVWSANRQLASGDEPEGVSTGDLDKDGSLDLVVANFVGDSISVYINNGNGTFKNKVDYPMGSMTVRSVLPDLNGDGKLDVAATNVGSNDVSVRFGNGDGTFGAMTSYTVESGPEQIVAGDLNGDKVIDLIASCAGTGFYSILLGNGDGTFANAVKLTTDLTNGGWDMLLADFNGDGKLDIASASLNSANLAVRLGNGDGTFQASSILLSPGGHAYLTAQDLNGDGKLDIVSSNFGTATLGVHIGGGDGTFLPEQRYDVNANPVAVIGGDWNADGVTDIAVGYISDGMVSLFLGRGDGSLSRAQEYSLGGSWGLVAGDFDKDGRLDIAGTNLNTDQLAISLNSSR